jgi:hypothetical protein
MQSPIIEKGAKSNEENEIETSGINHQLSNYNMDSGRRHRS